MRRVSSDEPLRRKSAPPPATLERVSSERHHVRKTFPQRANSLHSHSRSLSSQYPATPISSFYALNTAILHAFDSLYTQQQFQIAFAMGMQFVEMALLEIPKHGYYPSQRYAQERRESSLEAERVCQLLQKLVKEEEREEQERLEKLAQLARQQRASPEQTDAWSDLSICSDAITRYLCPLPETSRLGENASPLALPLQEPTRPRRRSKRQHDSTMATQEATVPQREFLFEPFETRVDEEKSARSKEEQDEAPVTFWEQPIYDFWDDESLSAAESADLEKALFLSGLDVRQSLSVKEPPKKPPGEIDIASLTTCYREDFYDALQQGHVRISRLSTHQGRLEGSINGCTLIAPLICIHHFTNELDDASWPDPGLPDAILQHAIDEETPSLLPQVRTTLGLAKDALIIPSDVHDFLLDRGLLRQEQFVTVCGGNLLNEAHLNEMVNAIVHVPLKFKDKKIAATLFFHEHVVAILKLDRGNGETWFDLIDSLPYQDTLDLSSNDFMESDDSMDDWADDYVPYAARIRCLNVDALRATLRWYACSKFNEKDRVYIDSYAWVDEKSDFDPRVFQAFVWAEG